MRRDLDEPRPLHRRARPNVVLRRQHKLVVHHPLRLVVQARRRVQGHLLVILHGEVAPLALQVRHLHEVPRENRLADVQVVVPAGELRAPQVHVVTVRDAHELRADVVRGFHRPKVQVVVPGPLAVLAVLLERVVRVQQRQVVPLHVRELRLRVVRLLLLVARPDERVGHREHRGDGEDLVGASELRRDAHHLRQLRVQRELGHHLAHLGEVPVVVQRAQVVEQLQRAHQRLGRGRVHEVEVHQVVDAELLQLEHHRSQVRAENLRVRLLLQVLLERRLRVQAETLPRPCAPRATGALVRGGARDGRHQQRFDADTRVIHLLLGKPGIEHVHDAVDGERRLGNVRGDDNLAPGDAVARRRRLVEDPLLLLRG
mmetsp:Transcript_15069/g.63555  ORF Transcript_15069/g.63555 Transcript_15069/m.63555 type:complete len:372 (+) Transcript_15069:2103-3218(+)